MTRSFEMKKLISVGLAVALISAAGADAAFAQRPLGDKDHDGVPNAVDNHDNRWDPAWGAEVRAPRGWSKHRNWNRHVGLCRQKYATFDMHRDMYRVHNRWVRCTLY
jgi:hypothetical protein